MNDLAGIPSGVGCAFSPVSTGRLTGREIRIETAQAGKQQTAKMILADS